MVEENLKSRIDTLLTKLNELLSTQIYDFSEVKSSTVLNEPGVYLIKEPKKDKVDIIYIGQTGNLNKRLLTNHRSGNRRGSTFRKKLSKFRNLKTEAEISNYIRRKCSFQFKVLEGKLKRNSLEHFAIALLQPELND